MSERGHVVVRISLEMLAGILRGDAQPVRATTAPADLEIVLILDPSLEEVTTATARLVCRSASFAPVPEGASVPEHPGFWYSGVDKPLPPIADQTWRPTRARLH